MNTEPALEWRAALRDDLRVAGPPAVRMLRGELEPDPLVVLPALQAAGLLDEATCGDDELRSARSRLLEAASRRQAELAQLLRTVDLSVGFAAAEDKVDALHRVVALGGLVNALSDGPVRRAAEDALAVEEAEVALAEADDEPLRETAGVISDALDLDAGHPLARVLLLLADPAPAASEDAFAAGLRRAQAALFPSVLTRWLARLRGDLARWLGPIAAQPALALGGAGDLPPISARTPVARHGEDEICLVRVGEELALEWCGDGPPPSEARLGGQALRALDPLVPGSRLWSLGEPAEGPLVVTLAGEADEFRVELDR